MPDFEVYEFRREPNGLYAPSRNRDVPEDTKLYPTEDIVSANIEEFGKTFKTYTIGNGLPVGIGVINADKLDNAKAIITTHNSKNQQNPGHVFECSVQAAVNPGQAIISVDSPRNLTRQERQHLRQDGGFTYYNYEEHQRKGLPTFESIGKLLGDLGYKPKYISGNHAGAHFGLGIAMGLPAGSVEGIYANGLHITKSSAGKGSSESEDVKGKVIRRFGSGYEQWAPNPARRNQVKQALPEIYGGASYNFKMIGLWALSTIYDLSVYRRAWSASDSRAVYGASAAVYDTANVLKYHESATMNAQFNKADKSQTLQDALTYGQLVAEIINSQRVRVIFSEGTRDEHTNHPSLRWEPEQWAFGH